jgi:hypothetical protein
MADARPPPAFTVGAHVEVVPSARHRTPWRGEVRAVAWHVKDRRWNYYLVSDGRAVSTRYLAEDLRGRG